MQQQGCEKRQEGWGSYNVADNFYISKEQAKYHIRMFNQSAAIGFLPALRDAAHYVPKIHKELGYVFLLYYYLYQKTIPHKDSENKIYKRYLEILVLKRLFV